MLKIYQLDSLFIKLYFTKLNLYYNKIRFLIIIDFIVNNNINYFIFFYNKIKLIYIY